MPRKTSKLYDDDDVQLALYPIPTLPAVQSSADCCLIGIILDVTMKKNITQ